MKLFAINHVLSLLFVFKREQTSCIHVYIVVFSTKFGSERRDAHQYSFVHSFIRRHSTAAPRCVISLMLITQWTYDTEFL